MKRCLQLIFGFVFAAAPASAQEPYSIVSTGISIGYDVARGEFQNAWSGSPLPVLSLQTPFHYGHFDVGAAAMRNRDNSENGGEDFTVALIFVGWGPSVRIGQRLNWRTFGIAGDFLMLFDEGKSGYSKRENELVLGAKSSLVFALSRHFEFEAGLMGIRVFTSRPIDLIVPTGGLRYRLTTSSRLRELMR